MKIIGHSLSILTKYKTTNWDTYCDTIALAYRTSIHPVTNNTPAYLTLGFDPKLPIDCDIQDKEEITDIDHRIR